MQTLIVSLAALVTLGVGHGEFERSDKEVITKTLRFPAGGSTNQLVVDNVNGSVEVTGYDGDDIQLVVHRTSFGLSDDKLKEAKEKIRLEIKEEPGRIIFYVNTPWRCDDGSMTRRRKEDFGFDADFDFDLRVPLRTDCSVSTINKGEITIKNVTGTFEVNNVNGAIEMAGITGGGLASTVNGKVSVRFTKNPESRCGFRTVNGSIEIDVPDDLSADLKFKTFNGEVYSDFDVVGMPREAPTVERIGRRSVYRGGEFSSVRSGKGGPEIRFETLNGDIRILRNHQ